MKIELTPKIEQWVQVQLAARRFATPQAALEHLIDQRQDLDELFPADVLRRLWDEGINSGPVLDTASKPIDGPSVVKAVFDKHRPADR